MTKDKEITKVVFRKFKEGDVIAILFSIPDVNRGNYMCYQHIGQHSECDALIANWTKPASEDEYKNLKTELESIGYNLKVYKRIQRN